MKYRVQYRDKQKIKAFREVVIEADDPEAAGQKLKVTVKNANVDIVSIRPWDPMAAFRKAILIIVVGGLLISGLILWAVIAPWLGSSPSSWH